MVSKVDIEANGDHTCKGYVLSCIETGRTIGSFWHDYDIEDVQLKINKHEALAESLKQMSELNLKLISEFNGRVSPWEKVDEEHLHDALMLLDSLKD